MDKNLSRRGHVRVLQECHHAMVLASICVFACAMMMRKKLSLPRCVDVVIGAIRRSLVGLNGMIFIVVKNVVRTANLWNVITLDFVAGRNLNLLLMHMGGCAANVL